MDVDSFITRHSLEWQHLDALCSKGSRGLAQLSGPQIQEVIGLYLKTTGHLAEAQTRYHDPRLIDYLNSLIARAHGAIYATRARTIAGLMRVFGSRYRAAIKETRTYIVVSAVTFILVSAAVMIWVMNSPEARAGLAPPFVSERIEQVGGSSSRPAPDSAVFSTLILLNNARVAFLAFALGISLGAGTIWVLIQNGILLGAIAGAFHVIGNPGRFWSLVLPHGFLEIVAIAIAAGAGLRMGWSIIDPGDRPRTKALADESRGAVLVVLGVIPAFALAAALEGFLTASPLPDWLEIGAGALIAISYVFFLFGLPVRESSPQTSQSPERLNA